MARPRTGTRTPPESPPGTTLASSVPPAGARRRGGQELPDDTQDRPEQNAGYDDAVRRGPAGDPRDPNLSVADRDAETAGLAWVDESTAEVDDEADDPDTRAARAAASDVRRRERRGADR